MAFPWDIIWLNNMKVHQNILKSIFFNLRYPLDVAEVEDLKKMKGGKHAPLLIDPTDQYEYPEENPSTIRISGTNVGVHTGGTSGFHPQNWGTLLTPKIM